jgi:hypothetical protein
LKKRSKKLLFPAVRASRNARARVQKFFGSFFQKRTPSLHLNPCWPGCAASPSKPDTLSEDAMIAATALVRSLVVVTRNVRDFTAVGVRTLDPFV